jgi:Gpi18-like mannosyltransferase
MLGTVWLLHGHVLFAEHLIFGLALFGACVVAESLIPYSGIAVATMAYFYSLMGMESSLFLLLIMLVAKAYTARRYNWLPLLLMLTMLTRFEGGLFFPILAVLFWRERTFPRIASFIPAFLIAVAYLLLIIISITPTFHIQLHPSSDRRYRATGADGPGASCM